MRRARFISLLVLWLVCCCGKIPGLFASLVPAAQVTEQPGWDRVFERRSGWTGGDVAASIIIPGERVLWLFGDSWVGEVKDNRRVNAVLVNNSIAIQTFDPGQPGKAPPPDRINFYWGSDDAGKPTAWLRPVHDPRKPQTWYWPTGGAVVIPDEGGNPRLALFLLELKKAGGDNVWGFECIGSRMALVDNVSAPVQFWKPVVIDLPHRIEGGDLSGNQIDWGVAAHYRAGAGGAPDYVFIYGVATDRGNNRELLLARVFPSALPEFKQWEFFAGAGKWEESPPAAHSIVRGVAGELSVDRIAGRSGEFYYAMVYSEPFLGDRIFARIASAPEGPWSDLSPVFTVAEARRSPTLFAYAAKGHAGLSKPRTLLVSYIVNSNEFNELVNDASVYRPRFICVPLDMIGVR